MKKALTLLAAASTLALAGTASADVIEASIGNTITVMMDGVETRFYFEENGSVSLANANGGSDSGTWAVNDGDLCITWQAMADGEPQCAALSQENPAIGDTFSLMSPNGDAQEATLQEGQVPF